MSQRITYRDDGSRIFEIDGKEVSEKRFFAGSSVDDMLSEGRAPYGVSDCTFMRGTANGRQFQGQEQTGSAYADVAKKAGVSITGKKYLSGLAAFPGDPEAWVDGRGDVQRVLEKRGWGSEGTVNVKPRERLNPPEPGPEVAPDLVEKYATEIAMRDPHPELVDMKDLKEQVLDRIKPKGKLAKKK